MKAAGTAIENLWKALEQGQEIEGIQERIGKRNAEKKEIEAQIAIEKNKVVFYTETQVKAFLHSLKSGDLNDETKRRGIINIFLSAIYLYDDKFTIVLNGGNVPIRIEDIPLDEIEADNESAIGSRLVVPVPPSNPLEAESESQGDFFVLKCLGFSLPRFCITASTLKTKTAGGRAPAAFALIYFLIMAFDFLEEQLLDGAIEEFQATE